MSKKTKLDFSHADCSRRIFETVPRQLDLARILGVAPSTVAHTKKRQQCSPELVIAASLLTGRPIKWFLYGERGEKGGGAPGATPLQPDQRLERLERSVQQLKQRVDRFESGCCSE